MKVIVEELPSIPYAIHASRSDLLAYSIQGRGPEGLGIREETGLDKGAEPQLNVMLSFQQLTRTCNSKLSVKNICYIFGTISDTTPFEILV